MRALKRKEFGHAEDSHSSIDDASIRSPSLFPSHLVEAMAAATAFGEWGDICFIVPRPASDPGWMTVFADLRMIQAHDANLLLKYINDNTFETFEAGLQALFKKTSVQQLNANPIGQNDSPSCDRAAPQETYFGFRRRFVPITYTSVPTLQAISLWLLSGHVKFRPLVMEQFVDAKAEVDDPMETCAAPCSRMMVVSPKAVYKAAHKFGLERLKELASDAIEAQITPTNALTELFGKFTLKYDEITKLRFNYVKAHWEEIKEQDEKGLAQIFSENKDTPGAKMVLDALVAQLSIVPTL